MRSFGVSNAYTSRVYWSSLLVMPTRTFPALARFSLISGVFNKLGGESEPELVAVIRRG